MLYWWMGLLSNIRACLKTGPKSGCFAGFCHHYLVATGAHTHTCISLSFVWKWMKTGLWVIALCRNDTVLLCKHNEQQFCRLF